MKTKKRHHSSEDDSEDSDASARSSSSDSESEDTTGSEHRYRKKKKRVDSSESDTDSDDHRRSKKRKHKKKKKKHVKRKRRSHSADSRSDAITDSSESDEEISQKKKRKKPKEKRSRSSSASVIEVVVERKERRLHSVVKERRRSSVEDERPARTYYQKEYRSDSPVDDFDKQRDREVHRFYRGSSKDRRIHEQRQYDDRMQNERFEPFQHGVEYPNTNIFRQGPQFRASNKKYQRGQKVFQYQRNPRYEGHNNRPPPAHDGYQRRPREENYHSREQPRGNNIRYNQFEERGPPRRNVEDARDNRERRGPPAPDGFREREFPERRERYREESFQSERPRDVRREKPPPPARVERPLQSQPPPHQRNNDARSHSVEERFRERNRRPGPEPRVEKAEPERRDERLRERVEPREDRADLRREPRRDVRRPERERLERERPERERPERERPERERPERERPERQRPERERPERERPGRERPERERPGSAVKSEQRVREKKTRFAESEGDKEYSWGKTEVKKEPAEKDGDKEKPNFGLSGKLTADANTVNGVVIKYSEPDDAKQPKRRWRFYPFKGDKALPILYIHRQSAFLIGRDKKIVDIMLEHPSISKQHAALQYRATAFTRPDGTQGRRVRPYVIDLESANGTFVNNKKIESRRYVELLEKDVVKFGFSLREYVLLHENSKDDAQDDDNQEPVALGASVTTTDQIKQEKRIKEETVEDGE